MREFFERDLQKLKDDILLLGSMVEDAIMESVKVLKKRDFDGSRRVIEADDRINMKRFTIEDEILRLIATQQPMAGDMRNLAAALEIVTELERMGDYAKGIANINLMIGEGALIKPLVDIPRMAEKSCDMLHRALDAFVRRDIEMAKIIPEEDDEVDELYNQVYHELIKMITKNSDIIDQATQLLWVAHNLERTADRVVNICERTVFMVTGSMKEVSATGGH
jgi:phosphate transport system protein